MKSYLFFTLFVLTACTSGSISNRSVASLSTSIKNCSSILKSFLNIKKAKFIDELEFSNNPAEAFLLDENSSTLLRFVSKKKMEENFYFGKETFYSIGKGRFQLIDEFGRSMSGRSFIKKGILQIEIYGVVSEDVSRKFVVDILNSLVFSSLTAKENYSHLKRVRIVGKQIVNEKLANLFNKVGFTPVIKEEGYGTMPFKEYFSRLINETVEEEQGEVVENLAKEVLNQDLPNDMFIELTFNH